jgi:nucleoside 2-deoxyribosyltransferase
MSSGPSKSSTFDADKDYPLLIARDAGEADFFLDELEKREYVRRSAAGPLVTLKGWERLEELKRSGHSSNRAFVAMWFERKMDDLWAKAIEPAILKAGYRPLRIDRHEHVNRIDDEIIGQIRRSRFMVADFTGQRHGVYFEAGFMMGLGRTVIWMCSKDGLKELHFDVRQFNFIDYASLEEAETRLYNRILAIEGEGPGAVEQG